MSAPVVSLAAPQDRSAVVDTFVSAFVADPAVRFVFPDDRGYARMAPVLGGYLFDRRVAGGTVWIADEGVSVAMWDAPDRAASDGPALELDAAARARWQAYDEAVDGRLPRERHWYLGVLATRAEAAGRRLGRAVLRAGLRAASEATLPAVLETSSRTNVDLYRRSGFEVVSEFSVGPLPVWMMRHPGTDPG